MLQSPLGGLVHAREYVICSAGCHQNREIDFSFLAQLDGDEHTRNNDTSAQTYL